MSCISTIPAGVIINVRLLPRASRNEVSGETGAALKIRVTAPPVDGKANQALVEFLSETLQVRKSEISILSGETSRNKRVLVTRGTEGEIATRLGLS